MEKQVEEEVEIAYNTFIYALNNHNIDEDYALNNHNHEKYPEIPVSFTNNPNNKKFEGLANQYTDARNRFYKVTFKKGGGKKRTRRGKSRSRKSRKSCKKKRTKKRRT